MIVKDIAPMVGIFSIVNNKLYLLQEPIENLHPVNDVYDAGKLFHIDLLKMIPDMDSSLDKELVNKLRAVKNPYEFPRGRICYNIADDEWQIYTCKEVAYDDKLLTEIMREFHLPRLKTKVFIDQFYIFKEE